MRSTDGLRPKIGRVIEPLKPLSAQVEGQSAQTKINTCNNTLPVQRVAQATGADTPLPAAAVQPSYGLGRNGKKQTPTAAEGIGNPEDDIDWGKVASIAKFLLLPAMFAILVVIVGVQLSKIALYGIAAVIGLASMVRAQKDPEILLALMIIYIPFAHIYAISIAPLVNGTNIFILLCLFSGMAAASRRGVSAFALKPGFKLMVAWFLLSSLSLLTLVRTPGALSYTLDSELTQYTGWISQFGFYLAVFALIKTRGQAKRAMVYIMFGTVIVVMFGVREAIDKVGLNSIDKQRLGGVFEQPNDFGGFLAYTFIPFIALFLFNFGKIKAWLLSPYLLLTLKILITTFSRGAYVAFALAAFLIVWMRGKVFLLGWGACALLLVAIFPQLLPDAVLDRINQTGRDSKIERLDKSSEHRFILWDAAIEMTLENPLTGKGFKAFPYLKAQYTKTPVKEADPHNMYLYISSQMGIPTLLLYLALMAHLSWMGLMVFRRSQDNFERVIGASMFAIVPCLGLINMFGSRMVGMSFVGYFYAMVVITQVLYAPYQYKKGSPRLRAHTKMAAEHTQTSAQVTPAKRTLGRSIGSQQSDSGLDTSAGTLGSTVTKKPLLPLIGRA